jgi:hypothetical protein
VYRKEDFQPLQQGSVVATSTLEVGLPFYRGRLLQGSEKYGFLIFGAFEHDELLL